MPEIPLTFPNARGETLIGVLHQSAQSETRGSLLFLHGWSGYRTGPHQMLTRAARHFGARGWDSLRFDFAGRGDSQGDTELATLATMRDDTFDAAKVLANHRNGPIIVVGLCSGCEIAVAAANSDWNGIALWSAPIFAALPEDSGQEKKRAANLGKYARKLLNPQTYLKIVRGQIDTAAVGKAMKGGGGAANKNVESNQAGQLPPGFRKQSLANWKKYGGPILQIYGDADPIASEARDWYIEHSSRPPRVEMVAGANHSFYGLEWERQVFDLTENWLNSK